MTGRMVVWEMGNIVIPTTPLYKLHKPWSSLLAMAEDPLVISDWFCLVLWRCLITEVGSRLMLGLDIIDYRDDRKDVLH